MLHVTHRVAAGGFMGLLSWWGCLVLLQEVVLPPPCSIAALAAQLCWEQSLKLLLSWWVGFLPVY